MSLNMPFKAMAIFKFFTTTLKWTSNRTIRCPGEGCGKEFKDSHCFKRHVEAHNTSLASTCPTPSPMTSGLQEYMGIPISNVLVPSTSEAQPTGNILVPSTSEAQPTYKDLVTSSSDV